MRGVKRILVWIPVSLFIFLGFCNNLNENGDQKLLNTILGGLNRFHYKPVEMNDSFSSKVYNLYLERLDVNKRFFLEKDLTKFSKYKLDIDDQCKEGSTDFFTLVNSTYDSRIIKIEKYINKILSEPFNFNLDETIEVNGDKLSHPTNAKEQKDAWRKALKLSVLEKVANKLEAQEKAEETGDTSVKIESFDSIEFKARKEVKNTHKEWFKRLKRMKHKDRYAIYLNSIASTYDPHTAYYPPKDKENFDIGMSGRLEGIGATLSERDGYIKVERIVPGSASYKQGELKSGDLIMKVAQGEEEPVDIVDMPLDDAVQLIRGKKGTEVRLTVKKPNGTIKVIPIVREVVIIEEGYAKSAVFTKDGHKYGYLFLPQFYADFNRKGGRSAGDDVKIELQKLQNENVEGIVFDLRNNGGGSLAEAIEIGGHFIEEGPIVQVKETGKRPQTYKDNDKGHLQYGGPLVVLVNSFSASASEIVAAALQDQNRAVIMGNKSTYGKGTVQTFLDLDRGVFNKDEKMGSLKLTIQKFYRVNGGATQLKGVVPDIIFPDHYDSLDLGEKDQQFPLPWDQIASASFSSFPLSFSNAVQYSNQRISSSDKFSKIREYTLVNSERSKNTIYSLNLEKFRENLKSRKAKSEQYKNIYKLDSSMSVSALQFDLNELASDTTKLKIKKDWVKGLNKDVYLDECFNVLGDLLPNDSMKIHITDK